MNTIVFILISLLILVPIWKVLVDSLDLRTSYGMSLWPKEFGFDGYITVFSNPTLYKPFLISVVTTVCGTALGLLLCTLGGYVLIQWKMPGRNILAGLLLFTMIFEGGMIPTYLVVNKMQLTNTLFSVIFIPAINIYNLVLMRNFLREYRTLSLRRRKSTDVHRCRFSIKLCFRSPKRLLHPSV